ncbi:TonB-dependent receptor [Sphaerotilus sp.]|uniref:TonB-dependent siderophore receptor n=1 Tax=Sphaerotilus sp. TaxID=2093942 RepID=UPI002ACDEB83|nr:TonB-dependent receptor [Sphaerotilus sp.]MDZ7855876.1 TonB-dependent receptor [Sphaerotilus sp.]
MPASHALSSSRAAAREHALSPLTQALQAALLGLAVVAASAALAPAAHAAEPPALDNTATKTYRIEAGPLGRALSAAAVTSGLALSFDPALTEGRNSPALAGNLTAREAFARLLDGSGLEIVLRSDGSYTLRRAAAPTVLAASAASATTATKAAAGAGETVLPVVRVQAAAIEGSADNAYRQKSARVGVLGDKSLKDTPYSIEVYPRDLIDNLQARSLADLTKADAAVSLGSDNLVTENNSLAIRGISPDFYTGQKIDGRNVRARASDLPLEHFESVDILKGAGAFLYGFGAPGGVLNYTLKRAGNEPVRQLNAQLMDSGLMLLHGDLAGRFGDQQAFGYRVNAVGETGDTYVEGGSSRRASASLALDWRITPGLVWRVDALAAKHVRRGGYWALIPNSDGSTGNWDPGAPLAPIDGSKRLAPSFTRYGSKQQTWGTDLSWQVAPDWSLSLAHRRSESGREFLAPAIFADAQGNYSMTFWSYANRFQSSDTQALLTGKLQTGPVRHDLSFGASRTHTRSLYTSGDDGGDVGSGNLARPVDFANPFVLYTTRDVDTEYDKVNLHEVFASDTLHLGPDWDLIAGLRRGTLDDHYSGYKRSATTPTLAAIYRPLPGLSVYASYVEALEQGATAPDTAANARQVFPPLISKQHEVGIKAEGAQWSATAALFRLQRGLTYTSADNVFSQDGEARYQGVELAGKARLSRQWLATASVMWLDATGQKTSGGALDGKRIPGVARQQIGSLVEYRLAGMPLTFSAGARYIGKRPLDADNQWQVGAVTLLDAGARFETRWAGTPVTLRLNIDNLADKAYWVTQSESSGLMQGGPRTVKLGAQFDF